MKTKEESFWDLITLGFNRNEAEKKLRLSKKTTDKYFKKAYDIWGKR